MTNTLALWLVAIIAAIFLVDALVLNWDIHIILLRKFVDLLSWLAFWR